ncbi:MAG: winged helix-turn-helix transcriptional regulator [Chitinivibrionales bacterium]|nr:winged helix-turn-helix transcriptional regulator [Chitinivibrionales bacterium]
MTREKGMARLCRGLGSTTRLKILGQLGMGQCSVNEISENLRLEQSSVSKHLAVLLDVGLVRFEVDGRRRCYRLIQPDSILQLLSLLKQISHSKT